MTISDWLNEFTPDRREVQVCFDRRLLSSLEAAMAALVRAREDADPAGPRTLGAGQSAVVGLEAEVKALTEQVAAKGRLLVFEGIGWQAWRDLIAKHPPQADQVKVFQRAVELAYMPHSIVNIGFDAATFVPAAIAASCTEPGLSIEEAERLLRTLPPGVFDRIWSAVLGVNLAGADDPFVGRSLNGSSGAVPASAKRSKQASR